MRQLYYLLIPFILLSCATTHYLCTVDKPTALYKNENTAQVILYIPAGKQLIAHKKGKQYRAVTFGNNKGYILAQSFPTAIAYTEKELRHLSFNSDSTYSYSETIQVKGYYRKDGTYVKPYTRKAPKRN